MLELEECRVDLDRRVVTPRRGDDARSLTTREADLLRYLAERPSVGVSREALITEVWGYADAVVSRACDNAVSRLRAKIEGDPARPVHVLTDHGTGYRFEPRPEPGSAPAPAVRPGPPAAHGPAALVLGATRIDLARRQVDGPTGRAALTTIEAALLARLRDAGGALVDRARLLRDVWGGGRPRQVDTAVYRLRAKIEADPASPVYLLSERGGGYRLALPPTPAVHVDQDALVGRDRDLEALAEALATSRWVVVTGPGGVGKTALVNRTVAGRQPVWWVSLAPATRAAEVCALVGRALELPLGPDDEAVAHIGRALGWRGAGLVVLDNLEQVADEAAPLIGAWRAAAPDIRFVGTSRARLGLDDEIAVELGPLSAEDGVALFERRARAASRSFRIAAEDGEAVRALVDRLDGLPLAIELAASRVTALGVDDLLARIDQRLDLLSRPRAAVDRHRSLRAAIDASWRLLDPDDADALLTLSLPDRITLDEVDELLGSAGVDRLQSLRDHNLLHAAPGGAGFAVYASIRAFAAEQRQALPDRGRAVELRWIAWIARLGEPAVLDQVDRGVTAVAARVARAAGDLERAARLAVGWGEVKLAVRCLFAATVDRLEHGPHAPWLALADEVRAAGPAPIDLAWLVTAQANIRTACGATAALDAAVEACALAAALDDPWIAFRAQTARYVICLHLSVADALADATRQAADAASRLDRPELAAWWLAHAQHLEGDRAGSARTVERALALAEANGNDVIAANALGRLGVADLHAGLPGRARSRLEHAIALDRGGGRASPVAALRLGDVLLALGAADALEALGAEVIRDARAAGTAMPLASAALVLADGRVGRGDPSWRDAALTARLAMRELGAPVLHAWLELVEARALLDEGDPRSAAALARTALDRIADRLQPSLTCRIHGALAVALALAGEPDAARAHADQATAGYCSAVVRPVVVAQRGLVAWLAGDVDAAGRALDEARALAAGAGLGQPGTEISRAIDRLAAATGG